MSNTRKRIKTKRGQHTTSSKPNPRQKHINAIQAEKDRLEALTPTGLRRVYASFPELEDLIDRCAWLVSVTDPTAGRSLEPSRGGDNDRVLEAGQRVAWFRGHQSYVQDELASLNKRLADKIEANDHDRYKPEAPRCWRRGCTDESGNPTRGRRQSLENEVCQWCGEPFSTAQTNDRPWRTSGARESRSTAR